MVSATKSSPRAAVAFWWKDDVNSLLPQSSRRCSDGRCVRRNVTAHSAKTDEPNEPPHKAVIGGRQSFNRDRAREFVSQERTIQAWPVASP